MSTEERIERNFFARDKEEQQAFLEQTWCDHCQEADLGMSNPLEYEQEGTIFVEGTCNRCGQPVYTELTDDDI
ncbi:hypothetical protein [Neptunomonas concharum]|uniref:Uncharacterized protein n=1 Tax=Neptunomonas concharum TaxID=1031538 RepID=A0A5P1RA48_9GAMM|nr:hypothetical protein [Neptunomonas concharum]QEQ96477.1 hypothetical protein F0U83_07020 [Neptunomonas concharum]